MWSGLVHILLTLLAGGAGQDKHGDDWLGRAEDGDPDPKALPVVIEVFYGSSCPHCLDFVDQAVMPLLEAHLPGNRVRLTFLPVSAGMAHGRSACVRDEACLLSLTPLCALRAAFPHPAPVDSEVLRHAAQFAACHLNATAGALSGGLLSGVDGDGSRQEGPWSQACADKVGLPWQGPQGLGACAKGPEALDIIYGAEYAAHVNQAVLRFRGLRLQEAPPIPWVFLNGDLLRCAGGTCVSRLTAGGEEPLRAPGSLHAVVCSMLDPQPGPCSGAAAPEAPNATREEALSAEQRAEKRAGECENCVEIRPFKWRLAQHERRMRAMVSTCIAVMTLAAVGALWQLVVRRAQYRRPGAAGVLAPAPIFL